MSDAKKPAPLPDYYFSVDKGSKWHLLCKGCDEAWSVPKEKAHALGIVLKLLNHARSHD